MSGAVYIDFYTYRQDFLLIISKVTRFRRLVHFKKKSSVLTNEIGAGEMGQWVKKASAETLV